MYRFEPIDVFFQKHYRIWVRKVSLEELGILDLEILSGRGTDSPAPKKIRCLSGSKKIENRNSGLPSCTAPKEEMRARLGKIYSPHDKFHRKD